MSEVKMDSKFNKTIRTDKRLRLEIDELLADVNDFMWLWHGWPIWVYRKVLYAPNTVTMDDRIRIQRSLTEQMPDYEQLAFVRRMIETQLPESDERKNRIEKLDRALAKTEHGRAFLVELIKKIDNLLGFVSKESVLQEKEDLEKMIMENSRVDKYVAKSWASIQKIFNTKPRSFRSRQIIESLMKRRTPKQTRMQDVSETIMKINIFQKNGKRI
uniref:Uncharacterized protein LOC113799392 n=1 Tax=Dermatophagoides pteronyssinus TaxID=6956 RepID=A0A6P6YKR9_DERPT|nr:uncharacterized protein LOC113799392 [Dermatophagoides pteronyssinus]